jgi:ABC-type bacteriocin/lantibiotic exporter with double-glycine peptidase domain
MLEFLNKGRITVQSDQREPAWRPARAIGAAEMPRNIFRYVLKTSGWHQLLLLLLTVGVFLLEVVPLELQRRIVNDLVKHRDYWLVIVLCAVYAGVVLVQGGTKLVLNVYRSWVGERATRDLRRRIHVLISSPSSAASGAEAEGVQASMIVAEVEPIGGFVGASVSEPLLQGGILASVLAYMIHVDLWLAGTVLALFLPQLVFIPLMQGAMNRRTRARVQIVRQLSVSVVEGISGDEARDRTDNERIDRVFELNMGIFRFKFTMNFLMNLSTQLQIIAALLLGGWLVHTEQLEIGGVVAVVSGVGRFTDPWGDLVNYFRAVNITQVEFRLMSDAVNQQAQGDPLDKTSPTTEAQLTP